MLLGLLSKMEETPILKATGVIRIYGKGRTAVEALKGVGLSDVGSPLQCYVHLRWSIVTTIAIFKKWMLSWVV